MEDLTKEIDRMLGGGYVFENGTAYYKGENVIEGLQKSVDEILNSLALLPISNIQNFSQQHSVLSLEDFFDFDEKGYLVFDDKIKFKEHVAFNGDTVGAGKIKAGDEEIKIEFEKEYENEPIITLTFVGENILDADFKYTIVDKSKNGFAIKINPAQEEDIKFDWHAFGTDKDNEDEDETTASEDKAALDQQSEQSHAKEPVGAEEQIPAIDNEPREEDVESVDSVAEENVVESGQIFEDQNEAESKDDENQDKEVPCVSDWQLSDWQSESTAETTACGTTFTQIKTYTDANNCGVDQGKPDNEIQEVKGTYCQAVDNVDAICEQGECVF